MALHNLARMTSATAGTGTLTLGSAVSGFLSFADAGVANGEVVTYAIRDGANSEIGRGTYTSSGTTLSRDTVLESTNSGNKITCSGTQEVFITAAAEDFLAAGWTPDANTWTYSSADSPTFVISINADMTGILQAGMRIKLTQTSAKYFIVTAVGAYSGGATTVTVYGGTDYTLANAAISSPYYSHVKSPFGFPMDPAKWTVSTSNGSIQQMNSNSPAQDTWYNSISLSIPIGIWQTSYDVCFQFGKGSNTVDCKTTLSTANNSESSNSNTAYSYDFSSQGVIQNFRKTILLNLAAKATYYINHLTTQASMNVFQTRGDVTPSVLSAVCAYL